MQAQRTSRKKAGVLPVIALALSLGILGGLLWWRIATRPAASQMPEVAADDAQQRTPAAPAPGAAAPAAVGSPASEAELEAISPHVLFRRVLSLGDVVRRCAAIVDALALGESPRAQLAAVAPESRFLVAHRGERTVIAPDAYHRYDDFADAVQSVRADQLASVYRALHPALEAAYRALGYPEGSIDEVTLRALRRLEAAPVVDEDVDVEASGNLFTFSDPRMESLGDVEKHLLRMGPRNTRLIQAKARELRRALGFPTETAQRAPRH